MRLGSGGSRFSLTLTRVALGTHMLSLSLSSLFGLQAFRSFLGVKATDQCSG